MAVFLKSPTTPVGMALAVLTVTQTSALVHSLSDSLDKEILDLRDTLGLPSDSGTWLAVLSVRQACRERIFEHRILSELVIHRDALRTIYPLVEGETGDLFEGLSAAIVTARQHFEELENVWHTLTSLADDYMLQMDAADRNKLQAACPSLQRVHDRLRGDVSGLAHDMGEWDDYFRTFMTETGFAACMRLHHARPSRDPTAFARKLAPLFERLELFSAARHQVREDCDRLCAEIIGGWSSHADGQIPGKAVFVELRKYEEYHHLLFSQSFAQSETIGSIKRLVDNAMKQTSTLYSITRAILPVDKVQAAFHRYDEMRVVCQHVMERCERGRKAMSEYVVELEKVRDRI